ncbi:hypothetical protein KQY27_06235 [Methanobrevibacter sp. TMH8]|uniref:hypothetical protein n=1 Tax=Methanobrevibacter sp. TMH8 TaxID=2848611 RepID=UPI001CCFA2C1|nr:hypothetical protein [Methanobrevibacter sp. TMH8]MBZ9571136.1 hypothetical protein [Methanobrevibacter sp. TMH8]
MKILNKKVIIALLLCAIFVCGVQLAFADPVSAATYKKFDSGQIKSDGITLKYVSYIKGKNDIYMKLNYKGITLGKIYMTKGKTKIKMTYKILGKKSQSMSVKHYGISLKTMYKYMKKGMLSAV